ncbi:MAG TPA: putative lipid II flippase FtsW, partial [Anaeromyxobacteraceae bacterium]|nr:putative lipid II flippase FtsW [Anaeromyxobacteraceae bacterium]
MTARDGSAPEPGAPPFDGMLLFAIVALAGIGAVMVYSASAMTAQQKLGDQFYYLKRQLLAGGIGLSLLVTALKLGHRRISALAYPLLVAAVVLLLLVLVPGIGKMAGGARRWIDLGLLRFQPAEAAKVALVLYLARSLSRKQDRVKELAIGLLPHLLVTGLLALLVLAERDLGTVVIMGLVLFAMLFAAGVPARWLAGTVVLLAPMFWYLVASTPYRLQRFLAYLDPWGHRDGAGFQLVESLLGIGNGGWLGQGLGEGKGKLFYLPAAPTDFIAAVIAEEAGLVGVALVLGLYALLVWRGLRAARRASDAFGCHAAVGLSTLVGAQALVNFAVVFGLLPTKGLTLPF